MPPFLEHALRFGAPLALALAAAWALDWMTARKGLTPPGFREPWRRGLAFVLTTAVFWIGITGPLGEIGQQAEIDVAKLTTPMLFLLHVLMVAAVLLWFALGFAGVRPDRERGEGGEWGYREERGEFFSPLPGDGGAMGEGLGVRGQEVPVRGPAPPPAPSLGRQLAVQFGFATPNVPREIGLGVVLGIAAWVVVLLGVILIGVALLALGGEKLLPKQPPAIVPWIAALPILVRLLISLSAGVVEEWFFRGFLQPRVGIALSTGCFVLAHFSYGEPFLLVGITILSLIYAFLVKWRQNIWPAIAAHALFDGVQLLVVIPGALRLLESQGGKAAALLGF